MSKTMDMKQKSLLVLTLVALGFLGYQVFQLVDRDITQTPVIAEQQYNTLPTHTQTTLVTPVPRESIAMLPAGATSPAMTSVPTPVTIPATATSSTPTITPEQHAYIQALDSYEIARMHHQLLDEEAAIAAAQQKIAMMHNQTAKISGDDHTIAADSDDDSVVKPAEHFVLSYIDRQNGQWSATLHVGADYESVIIGSKLPYGYEVIDINHQGVTLQKGTLREVVSFNGIDVLPAVTPAAVTHVVPPVTTVMHAVPSVPQSKSTAVVMQPIKTASPVATTHALPVQHVKRTLAAASVVSNPPVMAVSRAPATLKKPALARPVAPKPAPLPYQLSIHDMNAEEAEDDLDNIQLSMDLNLRSVEITPVMTQAYNTAAYLPQAAAIPQTYHLDSGVSTDTEQQYSIEARDDHVPRNHPPHHSISLAQHNVLKLPAHYYTIQLLGSDDPAVISDFISRNHLQHLALKLPVGMANHPWVIALYGSYPSFALAQEKLATLSPRIREKGAWIRSVGEIQKVVRSRFLS